MDTPPLKTRMEKFSTPAKKIHYITFASFLFGLAFCLPHGIVTHEVAPALGLIPLGIGALLALYRLSLYPRNKKNNAGLEYAILLPASEVTTEDAHNTTKNDITWQTILLALLDFGCFSGLIITVAFSILLNNGIKCRYTYTSNTWNGVRYTSSYSRCRSTQPMLAAWATMVMLVNAIIHLYLLTTFLLKLWTFLLKLWCNGQKRAKTPLCTRCHAPIFDSDAGEEQPTPKHEEYNEHIDQASSSVA